VYAVVFELEVVSFFLAVEDVVGQGAVAECAGEEVALTWWLAVQVAWDFPYGGLFWGCGIGDGDENGGKGEKQSLQRRHSEVYNI